METTGCDEDKVDEVVLALLYLNAFSDKGTVRAWKGFDWDSMNRLHQRGFISNPKGKAKSVVLSEEGFKRAEELFVKYFVSDK